MKRTFIVFVIVTSVLLAACASNLRPRYDGYNPQSTDGIECKSNCKSLYRSCKETALNKCTNKVGVECTTGSPLVDEDINDCRDREEKCLKVCEKPSDGGSSKK